MYVLGLHWNLPFCSLPWTIVADIALSRCPHHVLWLHVAFSKEKITYFGGYSDYDDHCTVVVVTAYPPKARFWIPHFYRPRLHFQVQGSQGTATYIIKCANISQRFSSPNAKSVSILEGIGRWLEPCFGGDWWGIGRDWRRLEEIGVITARLDLVRKLYVLH